MTNAAKRLALLTAILAHPGLASAATPGTLGATSTGSIDISATVPARVQISGLNDVAFGTVDPATAASSAQDVCVWSNTTGRTYDVTATGSGASSAFTLTDGSNLLPYSVEWGTSAGLSSGTAFTAGTSLTGLASAATDATCSSGPAASASLVVKMSTANMQAAVASSYTGTLTLVVAPR